MGELVVRTKEELEKAKSQGVNTITVEGELAKKLHTSKTIAKLSAASLAVVALALGASTLAAPVTGGVSYLVAAPVAASSGASIPAIIAASAIGLTLVIAIFKEYSEIDSGIGPNGFYIKLKKKKEQ